MAPSQSHAFLTWAQACQRLYADGRERSVQTMYRLVNDGTRVRGSSTPVRLVCTRTPGGMCFTEKHIAEYLKRLADADAAVRTERQRRQDAVRRAADTAERARQAQSHAQNRTVLASINTMPYPARGRGRRTPAGGLPVPALALVTERLTERLAGGAANAKGTLVDVTA
jgi:sRNA-binding protein